MTLIPELNLGITVLANLNLTLFPESIRAKFLEEAVGKASSDVQKEIMESQAKLIQLIAPEAQPKTVLPMAHKLEEYTGKFTSELYGVFNIEVKNQALIIKAGPAAYEGTLTHFSNDTFLLKWPAINSGNQKISFVFGPEGLPSELNTETLGSFKFGT